MYMHALDVNVGPHNAQLLLDAAVFLAYPRLMEVCEATSRSGLLHRIGPNFNVGHCLGWGRILEFRMPLLSACRASKTIIFFDQVTPPSLLVIGCSKENAMGSKSCMCSRI